MNRLLILSCSKRKRADPELLPALDRYDGPAFRVLRRYLPSHGPEALDAYIISAGFGLIPSHTPIPNYDQTMTSQRAELLRPGIVDKLRTILGSDLARSSPPELFVWSGEFYRRALNDLHEIAGPHTPVRWANGSPGVKLAQLHDWLWGRSVILLLPTPTSLELPQFGGHLATR